MIEYLVLVGMADTEYLHRMAECLHRKSWVSNRMTEYVHRMSECLILLNDQLCNGW
jgi:hypothetical protein